MDSEGEGIPPQLIPEAIARERKCSAAEVRDWPEEDVFDSLMWMDIEGRIARMFAKERERAALR